MRNRWLLGLLAIALLIMVSAAHATVNASYVKTLGQSNAQGLPLQGTGFRQLAADADGNLYFAVVTGWPWTALVKVAPEGRVIWQTAFGGYTTTPVALADGYLYAFNGYASQTRLIRCDTPSGTIDQDWGLTWTPENPTPYGIKKPESVTALLAAGTSLYLADTATNEIRRFDRATGLEKPFAVRVDVKAPIGLAAAKNGNVLVLTATSVLEMTPDGALMPKPRIDGLAGAQSIQVDAKTGLIYLAIGGVPGALINQIRQYRADGTPTGVALGRGGDFNGPWTPETFAFSAGVGDFVLDAGGGAWVSTGLGQLAHFAAPAFHCDHVLMSSDATSIAVDGQLNVYLGIGQGGMKLSWDNRILWTSGVRPTGDSTRFPSSPVNGWPVYLGHAAGNPLFHLLHDGHAYSLAAESGELVGTLAGSGQDGNFATRIAAAGDALYLGFGQKQQWVVTAGTAATLADWRNWKPFFTPPAGLNAGLLGVNPDATRVYLYDGKQVYCLDRAGTVLWQQPSAPFAGIYVHPFAILDDRLVFTSSADGKLVARDAKSGDLLAVIGDKKVKRRLPLGALSALAVAEKDGRSYLFVASNWQVQVYEIGIEE